MCWFSYLICDCQGDCNVRMLHYIVLLFIKQCTTLYVYKWTCILHYCSLAFIHKVNTQFTSKLLIYEMQLVWITQSTNTNKNVQTISIYLKYLLVTKLSYNTLKFLFFPTLLFFNWNVLPTTYVIGFQQFWFYTFSVL